MTMKTELTEYGYKIFCPGCGTHHYIPTEKVNWTESKWQFVNGNKAAPSFIPSVNISYPAKAYEEHPDLPAFRCHFFITNGMIQYCNDCTHSLSGKTVELPDLI